MTETTDKDNALRNNIRTKGNNAYYYAHNRSFEVPEDAIVRTGPGIITGGAPQRIIDGSENTEAGEIRYADLVKNSESLAVPLVLLSVQKIFKQAQSLLDTESLSDICLSMKTRNCRSLSNCQAFW